MKRGLEIVLMFCGVLFIIELFGLGWFYVADPLGIFSSKAVMMETGKEVLLPSVEEVGSSSGSVLTPASPSQAQVEAAAEAGVSIPTFTNEQLQCFEEVLGVARVNEIKEGAVPSPVDLFKAKACL